MYNPTYSNTSITYRTFYDLFPYRFIVQRRLYTMLLVWLQQKYFNIEIEIQHLFCKLQVIFYEKRCYILIIILICCHFS